MTINAMPIPAIIAPPSAPAARQNESSAPEKPFNQVLNKEVADRRQKNAAENEAAAPAKPSEPPKQAEPQADAGAADKTATAAHAAKHGEAAKEKKPDEKKTADEDGKDAMPSALLAMVASLTQHQAATVDAKSGDADASAAKVTDFSRLTADAHSAKGAKADGKQAPAFGNDPAAAIAGHAGEKAKAQQSSEIAELRNIILPATESKPEHQTSEAAAQPIVLPNLPAAAPLAASSLDHLQASGNRLTPQVGTPAWDQALGQKVVWMVAGAEQSASLSLNPPDLGPLQVVLNVSHAQADATFISAQPEVRQALEAALPKLRDMLGDAGIQLGQASVNAGTPQQQGNFGRPSHSSSRSSSASADDAIGPAATAAASRVSSGIGMVDTFA